jgi:hypothetical protein
VREWHDLHKGNEPACRQAGVKVGELRHRPANLPAGGGGTGGSFPQAWFVLLGLSSRYESILELVRSEESFGS